MVGTGSKAGQWLVLALLTLGSTVVGTSSVNIKAGQWLVLAL